MHRFQLIVLDVCEHASTGFVIFEFDQIYRGVARLAVYRDEVEGWYTYLYLSIYLYLSRSIYPYIYLYIYLYI